MCYNEYCMKKILKNFTILVVFTLGLFIIFFLSYVFLAFPYKIVGGNIGKYKKQQIVFSSSLLIFFHPLVKGDIVSFYYPSEDKVLIGEIIKTPGEFIGDDNAYDLYDRPINNTLPTDTYLIKQEKTDFSRVAQKREIKGIVWWP